MSDTPKDQGTDQTVVTPLLNLAPTLHSPSVWRHYPHAPGWFEDVVAAATEPGVGGRRREILLAVTFLETYLVEWLLWDVFAGDLETGRKYLRELKAERLTERWKELPKQLKEDGVIPAVPDTGNRHGQEWAQLIWYRRGLVHAQASRPETSGLPDDEMPFPTKDELDALEPGWALGIVVERVHRLHRAVGSTPPDWFGS